MAQIKEAYLDSSVFITANLDADANGRKARSIIKAVGQGLVNGHTASLTFDEVAFIVRKYGGFEKSIITGDSFLRIPHLRFIDVTYEVILSSQELIKKYKIKPRDAIHAACALSKNIKTIVSDDADFDEIKESKRLSIQEFRI